VLILLPPSEGKAASGRGAPFHTDRLWLPALSPAREAVLDRLIALSADEPTALTALGLGQGQVAEVRRNTRLRTAPALPAARLYTGVLYEALDLASLDRPARRLADRSIAVFSGLWGAVRLSDRVPPYRCSIGAALPGLGSLTGHWKRALRPLLDEVAGDGPVLDLRSAAYAAMWTPRRAGTVTARVLHERTVDGRTTRSVVSHFNKATKGRVVRDLLTAGALPRSPTELVTALRDLRYEVEDTDPTRLDIVVKEL
jgi:cytoplasmic iron level regulating protein YaaA (DUF328/UPF0246 family)